MGTKGPSNQYGNALNGKHGHHTDNINFPWAKDFNKRSLNEHFKEHKDDFNSKSIESYKQHAIKFANDVDRQNYKSFVGKKTGKTFKYNPKTNEFVVVDKRGYIVTYYKPKQGADYYYKQTKMKGIL